MKSVDPHKSRKLTLAEVENLAARDKRRMLVMGFLVLAILAAFLFSRSKTKQYESDLADDSIEEHEEEQSLFIPVFDQRELVEAIDDASSSARLTIDTGALHALLRYTLALTPRHFESMSDGELDSQMLAAIATNPADHRLAVHRARGKVVALHDRKVEGASNDRAWFGTLELADESRMHFYVDRSPREAGISLDGWARFDGLFLQLYKTEQAGGWVDAPLLVGRELVESYPYLTLGEDLATPALDDIKDDTLDDLTGISLVAKWQLMAKALQASEGFDWDNAPELTSEVLNDVYVNGDKHRGQPYIIPISLNVDTRSVRAEENPLHLPRITEGWIGNYVWKGKSGSIKWWGPWVRPDLEEWRGAARLVKGRGFFLKNYIYMAASGKPERAPLFVMTDVQIHTPVMDMTPTILMWGMVALTAFLVIFFTVMVMRDRRSAQRLHEDLVRRKRARRERAEARAAPQPEAP